MNINPLLEAISIIILEAPIEQKELVAKLRHKLCNVARKKYPGATIGELSEKIGILRGKISENLKDDPPKIAPSCEARILNVLWQNKDENDLIDYKGENSFYSIAEKQLVGRYSPDVALNSLIKSSSIEFKGDKIQVNSRMLLIEDNIEETMRIVGQLMLRLVGTVMWNVENEDKLFQRSVITRGIPPESIDEFQKMVFHYLQNTTIKEIQKMMALFEIEGRNDFPEYVFSVFESYLKVKKVN